MNIQSILLLLAVGLLVVRALRSAGKKKCGCCGDCKTCGKNCCSR